MSETDLITRCSRLFIEINDENRFKRRKALEKITDEIIDIEKNSENDLILICSKIINEIFDNNERNRELTCEILTKILDNVKNVKNFLPILIPVLIKKLNDKNNIETSEEIRLQLITILKNLIDKSGNFISIFIEEIINVCCITLTDNFGEIKRKTCLIIIKLSELKDQYFHSNSEKLVMPLIGNLCHQHSKVRHDNVLSLGKVLLFGSVKSFDTVCSNLAQRLFDDNVYVRFCVIKVFGEWLLDLPDRYSFHSKLIPVFLSGFIDENDGIKELTSDLWHDIGLKYLQENEKDLKDEIDFQDEQPDNYPSSYERPNLGCRVLLFRTLSRILPALTRDLSDWSEDTRLKAAKLLAYLIINGEGACTQHCQLLIGSTLIRGLVDEVAEVRGACRESSKLLGYFVDPKTWWHVLQKIINQCDADDSFLAGEILLLSCILELSDCDKLINDQVIEQVCQYLKSSDISGSFSTKIKAAGLQCTLSIISKYSNNSSQIFENVGYSLFYSVLSFASYESQESVDEIRSSLDKNLELSLRTFSDALSLKDCGQIYEMYMGKTLSELLSRVDLMTCHSSDRLLCCKLLISAGPVIGHFIDPVLQLLKVTLNKEKDIELRLKFFMTLVKVTSNMDVTFDSEGLFNNVDLERLLDTAIIPNLMWQAGRTAEALRIITITCLWSLLVGCCKSSFENKINPFSKLSPLVWRELLVRQLSVLEDDVKDTRMTSCRSLVISFDIIYQYQLVETNIVERDQLHSMYPAFIKRMDDVNDEIRILTTKMLLSWINILKEKFDASLYRAHLEDLISGMLVHLDDSSRQVQLSVYEVVLSLAHICTDVSIVEIKKVRNKHRSPKLCDDLLLEIESSTQ